MGKIAQPNEFGKLVTIQESEHQIVTTYEVHAKRPANGTLWTPSLDRHQAIFGRSPDIAAADRGFSSARNEQAAIDRGVRRVILPRCGPNRQRDVHTSGNAGSAVANDGAPARKDDQRFETTPWAPPLSLQWARWREALDRTRRHRQRPSEHRNILKPAGHMDKSMK